MKVELVGERRQRVLGLVQSVHAAYKLFFYEPTASLNYFALKIASESANANVPLNQQNTAADRETASYLLAISRPNLARIIAAEKDQRNSAS